MRVDGDEDGDEADTEWAEIQRSLDTDADKGKNARQILADLREGDRIKRGI